MLRVLSVMLSAAILLSSTLLAADKKTEANRLTYLDEPCNPYYVHKDFPKLTTPMWVGEEGVEAVVILAIDDMRDPPKYEAYLRPILNRLKQIDGRAPLSIMTCNVKPDDPQLQSWLAEGLSLEIHTVDHPCPLLQGGDLAKAKSTYDRCVDLMSTIPGNKPVAFRMPCCDSLNTASPRFFTEIFNRTTEKGNYLQIDTSVFNVFTSDDPSLPRELVLDADGKERFVQYIPSNVPGRPDKHANFVNTIENYPYPYVIDRVCWEFPCVTPSDWSAQFRQKPNNPKTIDDWKAALDLTVIKQGVFCLVFHPHNWIRPEQVNELIDHAVIQHGKKVKFLTFRESIERLNKNLLANHSLRTEFSTLSPVTLSSVQLIDIDNDRFIDVLIHNHPVSETRIWRPLFGDWKTIPLPAPDDDESLLWTPAVFDANGGASMFSISRLHSLWDLRDDQWTERKNWITWVGHEIVGSVLNFHAFRDVNRDGIPETIVATSKKLDPPHEFELHVGFLSRNRDEWNYFPPIRYPSPWIDISFWNQNELGIRFVDLNEDGFDDLIYSTSGEYSVRLFQPEQRNWSQEIVSGKRGSQAPEQELPMIARPDGTNNGFWVHSRQLIWQNEDTAKNPQLIETRSFDSLLALHRRKTARIDAAEKQPLIPIGAASIDITPDYPIRLTGYASRQKESEGVAQRIFAKAIAIKTENRNQNSKKPAETSASSEVGIGNSGLSVLITVDNCGVTGPVVDEIFAGLTKKHALRREHFVVCSTHTHTGPWLPEFAPLVSNSGLPPEHLERMKKYRDELIEKLVKVAEDAIAAQRPGRLYHAEGSVGFAANRRVLENGQWKAFGVQKDGPVDHRLPVLVAKDVDGKLIAVLSNYACHCTTLGGDFNQIAGDWAGYASEYIEKEHPGAVSLIAIGCGADANPAPRGKLEMCQQHGRAFADEVKRLLASDLLPIDPNLEARYLQVDLPLGKLPTKEEWEAKAKQPGVPGIHGQRYLDMLNRGETIPTSYKYPIATWQFGNDLAMVFLGGEVVVDYSRRLSREFDAERLWITAYANDVPSYIASKRILQEGGYEADFSMLYYDKPTRLAPEAEDVIVDSVQKLLRPGFYSAEKQVNFPPPKSPEESLATIKVRPGLKVELVAAEPLIADPVAFDWDERGRLWVVEMSDYPNGVMPPEASAFQNDDLRGQPGGRIKILTDTDGDGRYDQAQTFLEGIPFPNGIQLWRDGALVTAAPEIFFAADRDGDGRAEVKQTLYRGFHLGNQQHRVNGLRLGLDNWVYVGNGDSGGEVQGEGLGLRGEGQGPKPPSPRPSAAGPEPIRGRDLRIRPDEGLFEAVSGQTQFGRERNDWGDWFGCNNSRPIWHYVLEDRYLRRNPHVAVRDTKVEVAEVPGAAPVFPISRTLSRFNDFDRANRFTSACSTTIYRDCCLGDEFYGNAFTCEPVHNLISRLVLTPEGVTYRGRRAVDEQQSEFLASSDNWFRPVMVRTGPDGGLWIADMYRFVIEHPRWIPPDWQRKLDLRAGDDRGRIYRVVPEDAGECCGATAVAAGEGGSAAKTGNKTANNAGSAAAIHHAERDGYIGRSWFTSTPVSTAELVERLASANGWWRDTTQRLLVHRQDRAADEPLTKMAIEHASPLARLHALCTLDGLQALSPKLLVAALADKHPGVRRHAVRLSEGSTDAEVVAALAMLVADPDSQVQMQLAWSAGSHSPEAASPLIASLAVKHHGDEFLSMAVASSLSSDNIKLVLHATQTAPKAADVRARLIGQAAQFGQDAIVSEFLKGQLSEAARDKPVATERLLELADLIRNTRRNRDAWKKITGDAELAAQWTAIENECLATTVNATAGDERRGAAIQLLGLLPKIDERSVDGLVKLVTPREPVALQQSAVRALADSGRADVPARLMANWASHSPSVRAAILDTFLERGAWTSELLDQLDAGRIVASDIDAARRERLLRHVESSVRDRAAKLFAASTNSSRRDVVERFKPVLAMAGDVKSGRAAFEKRCGACHAAQGVGKTVGADLGAVKDRSSPALLTAILDPNQAVEARYFSYTAVTNAGRSFSGLLLSETGTSVTLVGTDGKEQTLLRSEIDELVGSNRSFMPEGLEKDITEQELADIIAFVQSGQPPKKFAGNEPRLVQAAANGSLTLPATAAEIFGPSLVFEAKYQNLGYWSHAADTAVWSVEVSKSGTYDVVLDYACDNSTAGNELQINVADQQVKWKVTGTGTWDEYRRWKVARITLSAGRHRVQVAPLGEPRNALIDLRSVLIEPASR